MSRKRPDGWHAGAVGIHDNDGQRVSVRLSRAVDGSELIVEYLDVETARELARELKRAAKAASDPDFWRKVDNWGIYE